MAIAVASILGFNVPDLILHPIFGAVLDAHEPVAAYKIIFGVLFALLATAFLTSLVLMALRKKDAQKSA